MSASTPPANRPRQPTLQVPADLEPVYANVVRIAHAPSEIVFEFAHLFPGSPNARVRARVVMAPLSAKLLHRALTENLAKYEANFGEITIPVDKSLVEYSKLFRPGEPGETDEG